MGILHSVARVDCLSAAAMRRLEEWSPIRLYGGGQNPAYRPSGIFLYFSVSFYCIATMHLHRATIMVCCLWREQLKGKAYVAH
jgi:hypothetical protein